MYKLHVGVWCKNSEADIAVMKYKLSLDPNCLNRQYHNCFEEYVTPLACAAKWGHLKCMEFLLSRGADHTVEVGNVNLVNYTIEEGSSSYNIVKYLFDTAKLFNPISDYESDVDNNYLTTTISNYCVAESLMLLELLIEKYGVPVDDFNHFNITLASYSPNAPSVVAILFRHSEALKYLLLNGAVIDYRQTGRQDLSGEVKDCLSLIHYFALYAVNDAKSSVRMFKILHQFGANLWEKNRLGLTPLQVRQDEDVMTAEVEARNVDSYIMDIHDEDETQEITEKMQELMATPLSLQSWCRISLLRYKGTKYLQYVKNLEPILPGDILHFLKAEELPVLSQYEILSKHEILSKQHMLLEAD